MDVVVLCANTATVMLIKPNNIDILPMACWEVLPLTLLSSAIVFGYTYCLDLPQALEVPLREPPYSFSTGQFNLLYFFTYLPVLLLSIPLGAVVDRWPLPRSMFTLLLLSLGSQVAITLLIAARPQGYTIGIYCMRMLFGLGGEGSFTVQGLIIDRYCTSNFEVVMAVALSLPFLMDSLNSLVTTRVYESTNSMVVPWALGAGVCGIALMAGVTILLKYIRRGDPQKQAALLNSAQSQEQEQSQQFEAGFSLSQLRTFPKVLWVLIATSFFAETTLGGFMDNINDLLVKRFGFSYSTAGLLLTIPFSGLTLLSIIVGLLFNRRPTSRRPLFVLSSTFYLCCLCGLYLLPNSSHPSALHYAVVAVFCFSISACYSVYFAAVQASVPKVVGRESVGTAFGVLGSSISLSLVVTPFVNIAVLDSVGELAGAYERLSMVYVFLGMVPACFALYLRYGPFERLDQQLGEQRDIRDSRQSA